MFMKERVIVVTGGNRGIGREICRQLARTDAVVLLTSRDEKDGLEAVEDLNKQELPVRYHQLDVTKPTQILGLTDFLSKEFGRCDGLVNNAGIFLDNQGGNFFNTDLTTVRETMETNVYGPYLLTQALVPLMRKNNYGRIVNMSSGLGRLSEMGANYPAYRMSKTAINAITRVLSSELAGTNILVNSMCPGWVKTRMGGPNAPRPVEQGADTAVWLATLPDGGPTGKIFLDRKEVTW
ncbi:MAG: SDR family oxidoreductase [Candidatus Omnitrophica bacterium]|nr:SDR family oxidoreductase [Candidatus Omnitrophota bacterium]